MRLFINFVCLCAIAFFVSTGAFAATIHVPADYSTIQAAINAASPTTVDTIIVSPGTYVENINFNGKNIVLTSTDPYDQSIVETTIIDGNQNDSVVTFSGSETPACELRGFTITNGKNDVGGGINGNRSSNATIKNCIITGNTAIAYGGGLDGLNGLITNCTITENHANWLGGGLCACNGIITNCNITNNNANYDGGGLNSCDAQINNCLITQNTSQYRGGGLIFCDGGITNCTIIENYAVEGGGVSHCEGTITNCIIWGNLEGTVGSQVDNSSIPTYSCIQDWTGGGTGNITSDPLFVNVSSPDPNDWDFHLLTGSACIDTGTNTPSGGLPATDIEDFPRPIDGDLDGNPIADMGAYEFHAFPDDAYLYVESQSFSFTAFEDSDDPAAQTMIIRNFGNQTLNWSVDLTNIPDWLTVTPTSGTLGYAENDLVNLSVDINSLSEGHYNYSFQISDSLAANSPLTITVDLEVIGPILDVSSNTFPFSAFEGGINPVPKNLTISNVGGGTLNWASDLTDKPQWLIIAPTSGTLSHDQNEPVTLSVDISGLPGGQYSYAFEVSDPNAVNSPQSIIVDLEVVGPVLAVDPNTFEFTVIQNGSDPNSQTLTISNVGGGTLNWASDLTDKPQWLIIAPTSGTLSHDQNEPVTLSVDISGLPADQYSYSFEVLDPIAQNSPQTVTVDLQVKGAILNVSSNTFEFMAYENGDNPDNQTMVLSNSGGGTLNWTITDVDEIGLSLPDWLTLSPITGSLEPDPNVTDLVTLSVDIAGLSKGEYSYSFDVSDPLAQNSPQTVTVDLVVTGPILELSPDTLTFTAFVEGNNPDNQTLSISNSGGGTLNWSISDVNEVGLSLPDWLTISPTSGSTESVFIDPNASDTVTLSVDITDLLEGLYSYSFKVFDPTAQNSPQIIDVTLIIGPDYLYVPTQYPTIQSAIDAADFNDIIMVLPGTYYENINFNGKDIILTSTDPEDPNIMATTVIDGGGSGSVVTFFGSETTVCLLRGFTITNGDVVVGGGINGNRTHAAIEHCAINDNSAVRGGGLYECDGIISNCTIADNTAICLDPEEVDGHGGGLYRCDGIIINCMIIGNFSDLSGGGLYDCDGRITNCIITDNDNGAGFGCGLMNCNASITNCIVWGNPAYGQDVSETQLYGCSTPRYTCIQSWTSGGAGNISSDPLFTDVSSADSNDWDFHLKSEYGRWSDPNSQWVHDTVTSPCIDAGDPNSIEWQHELWPHGGRINMGVYGGTPQASMSPNPIGNIADLDHDDEVGVVDLELFCEDYLLSEYLLDTDLSRNGKVDITDFSVFAQQWLWVE